MIDAKEVLRREYARVVDRLGEVDPVLNPELYLELIRIVENLYAVSGMQAEDFNNRMTEQTAEEIIAEVKAEPIPEVEEPEEANPVADEPEKANAFTKEEVRAALAESRKKGVNVTELLKGMGYDNFTAVPAAKYGEVMDKLGQS